MLTANYFFWVVPTVPDKSPVAERSDDPSKHEILPTVPVVPAIKQESDEVRYKISRPAVEVRLPVQRLHRCAHPVRAEQEVPQVADGVAPLAVYLNKLTALTNIVNQVFFGLTAIAPSWRILK